jgi:hypothetical protein
MELLVLYIIKILLIVFSGLATVLCLVFMLALPVFRRIEESLGTQLGSRSTFISAIEGDIDVINDWVYKNHVVFGPIFAVLSAMNTRNAFFF